MAKVAIIGAGRLAWNLIPALQAAGNEVFQLISRNKDQLIRFTEAYSVPHTSQHLSDLQAEVDFVLLTVTDKAIEEVARQLADDSLRGPIFLHTSGSISLASLKSLGDHIGVFYPMQIFTFDRTASFEQIPFFLEGS